MGTNNREVKEWSLAVAAQVRAERAASGMTQAEVYASAEMTRSTYLRIESGARVPDIEDLAMIAPVFGLTIQTLLERAESRLNPSN